MATNSSKTSTPYLNTAQVERAYSRYAHLYDVTFGKLFNEPRRIGVECLDVQSGERILEVGVGTGISLSHYRNDCSITAIDVSDEMLEHSQLQIKRHGLNHVTIANMDAANMQFSDNSFDAVMAAYVITAVPDHKTVIQEMVRVCRPGGRIVFINHFSNGNQLIGSMEKLILSDEANFVVVPGSMGELGIFPKHAPLLSTLEVGEVRVTKAEEEYSFFISGGFIEILPGQITILANTAERAENIDEARAKEARDRAEALTTQIGEEIDIAQAEASLKRATVRLKVMQKRRASRAGGPAGTSLGS